MWSKNTEVQTVKQKKSKTTQLDKAPFRKIFIKNYLSGENKSEQTTQAMNRWKENVFLALQYAGNSYRVEWHCVLEVNLSLWCQLSDLA